MTVTCDCDQYVGLGEHFCGRVGPSELRKETEPPWEWGRAWRSGMWHRVRLYRDGITVFRCVGYREGSSVEDGSERLPRGAKVCRRCAARSAP